MKFADNNFVILLCIILGILLIFFVVGRQEQYRAINVCNSANVEHLINKYTNCNWNITDKVLGKGETQGIVLEAYCDSFPNKVFAVKMYDNVNKNKLLREALNQMSAGSEIAPEIYDVFICGNKGYIVMDKVDMSLFDFLKSIDNIEVRDNVLETVKNEIKENILETVSHKFLHDDTKYDNIMINVLPNNNYQVVMIDWAFVQPLKDETMNYTINNKMNDIDLTFKLLKSHLDRKSNDRLPPDINIQRRMKKSDRSIFSEPLQRYSQPEIIVEEPMTEPLTRKRLFEEDDDVEDSSIIGGDISKKLMF
jgi:hypothetical protein